MKEKVAESEDAGFSGWRELADILLAAAEMIQMFWLLRYEI